MLKAPLRNNGVRVQTGANGCNLDYAPFTVVVSGHELSFGDSGMELVLTSLHMPPSARRGARDRQLAALLSAYSGQADVRMQRPFTLRGARDAHRPPCVHVLMGDFNCWPGETAGAQWRTLIPRVAATTGGGGVYDNVMINADGFECTNTSWDVLRLAKHTNTRRGVRGLSDHDPILLEIKSVHVHEVLSLQKY